MKEKHSQRMYLKGILVTFIIMLKYWNTIKILSYYYSGVLFR